jgi:hypothetical protein
MCMHERCAPRTAVEAVANIASLALTHIATWLSVAVDAIGKLVTRRLCVTTGHGGDAN